MGQNVSSNQVENSSKLPSQEVPIETAASSATVPHLSIPPGPEREVAPDDSGGDMAFAGAATRATSSARQGAPKFGWRGSSLEALRAAEDKLFGATPGLRVFDTDIGNGQHIHTVEAGKGKSKVPLVLCHGYGMAVGGWHMVLHDLSSRTHVLAKDWLGNGLSSRPKWETKGVEATEAYFVESLERWREANGLDKMVLCGHSLGGYLSVAYAEKYPERLEKLVLASPVGFPDEPPDTAQDLERRPFAQKNLLKFIRWGWQKGITPGDVIRTFPPLGYRLMMGYSRNRFSGDFDKEALGEYLYHNLAATQGSGERALHQLLKPGAWAHSPLRHRLPKIDKSIPVHFIYGAHDWMDATAAEDLKTAAEAGETGQRITLTRVPRAGHQLFLDNPREFNQELLRACEA